MFRKYLRLTGTRYLQISVTVPTQKKEVDDVLGGEAAWANVDKTKSASILYTHPVPKLKNIHFFFS